MFNKIKETLISSNGRIVHARANKKYLQKHGLFDYIDKPYDDSYALSEKIYCTLNEIKERPKCYCGNPLRYIRGFGYHKCCSRKCANNDPINLLKNKEGVSKALKKAYQERGLDIKEKRIKTLNDRYQGTTCTPFSIKQFQEKGKETLLSKYGVDNVFKLKQFRSDNQWTKIKSVKNWKKLGYNIEYITDGQIKVHDCCKIHNPFITNTLQFHARYVRKMILCPICKPISTYTASTLETNFK